MNVRARRLRHRRQAATLIDVIAGSMLMGTLLIPSMHLISQSRANTHRLNVRQSLVDDAGQVIEQAKIAFSDSSAFASAYASGIDQTTKVATAYGSHAVARLRVDADRSAAPAQLLTIVAEVWHDDDHDGRLDTGEPSASLRTQWAAP